MFPNFDSYFRFFTSRFVLLKDLRLKPTNILEIIIKIHKNEISQMIKAIMIQNALLEFLENESNGEVNYVNY